MNRSSSLRSHHAPRLRSWGRRRESGAARAAAKCWRLGFLFARLELEKGNECGEQLPPRRVRGNQGCVRPARSSLTATLSSVRHQATLFMQRERRIAEVAGAGRLSWPRISRHTRKTCSARIWRNGVSHLPRRPARPAQENRPVLSQLTVRAGANACRSLRHINCAPRRSGVLGASKRSGNEVAARPSVFPRPCTPGASVVASLWESRGRGDRRN